MTTTKAKEHEALLRTLRTRFEGNMRRHAGVVWAQVQTRLEADREALGALAAMETTGGEPDVVGGAGDAGRFSFFDCSPESPAGRRSVCYDAASRLERKEHRPERSAIEMAAAMGTELLTEEQYRQLQMVGEFDLKTSSWIQTPNDVRDLGGALFCDRRYGKVFVYHNGAQSYYAARGFRCRLVV